MKALTFGILVVLGACAVMASDLTEDPDAFVHRTLYVTPDAVFTVTVSVHDGVPFVGISPTIAPDSIQEGPDGFPITGWITGLRRADDTWRDHDPDAMTLDEWCQWEYRQQNPGSSNLSACQRDSNGEIVGIGVTRQEGGLREAHGCQCDNGAIVVVNEMTAAPSR